MLAHVALEEPGLREALPAHLTAELRRRRGFLGGRRRRRGRGGLAFRLGLGLWLGDGSGFWLGWRRLRRRRRLRLRLRRRLRCRRRGRQGALGAAVGRQAVAQQLLLLAGAEAAQAALPGPVQDVQVAFALGRGAELAFAEGTREGGRGRRGRRRRVGLGSRRAFVGGRGGGGGGLRGPRASGSPRAGLAQEGALLQLQQQAGRGAAWPLLGLVRAQVRTQQSALRRAVAAVRALEGLGARVGPQV